MKRTAAIIAAAVALSGAPAHVRAGMVWYSESGVRPNTIVRFDPRREEMARAAIPSGGGVVRNMAATRDGRVYIACSGVNKVGVVERRY